MILYLALLLCAAGLVTTCIADEDPPEWRPLAERKTEYERIFGPLPGGAEGVLSLRSAEYRFPTEHYYDTHFYPAILTDKYMLYGDCIFDKHFQIMRKLPPYEETWTTSYFYYEPEDEYWRYSPGGPVHRFSLSGKAEDPTDYKAILTANISEEMLDRFEEDDPWLGYSEESWDFFGRDGDWLYFGQSLVLLRLSLATRKVLPIYRTQVLRYCRGVWENGLRIEGGQIEARYGRTICSFCAWVEDEKVFRRRWLGDMEIRNYGKDRESALVVSKGNSLSLISEVYGDGLVQSWTEPFAFDSTEGAVEENGRLI